MSKTTPHEQPAYNDTVTFGFYLYLFTDLLVFAVLFATFAVLRNGIGAGPSGAEIFDLPLVFAETLALLLSSLTIGLGLIYAYRGQFKPAITWLVATFLLGAVFLGLEFYEFNHLLAHGHSWQTSGFLSAYYTLVGTHGLHIIVGLLWLSIMFWHLRRRGLDNSAKRKLGLLSIYWHFLDLVWIFIFTVVYLMGVAS